MTKLIEINCKKCGARLIYLARQLRKNSRPDLCAHCRRLARAEAN